MTDVNYVTESDFQEEVIGATLPVLVDFTATWCQPCKMIEPIVKQLAGEWEGKVKVVKGSQDFPKVFQGDELVPARQGR